jgi:hypothetical protein
LRVAGLVLRSALLTGVVLPLRLPAVFYKKLVGKPLDFRDWAEIAPVEAQTIQNAREECRAGKTSGLCFAVGTVINGKYTDVPLVKRGEKRDVTAENFDEFVAALVKYHLVDSIQESFDVFRSAFLFGRETAVMSKLNEYDLDVLLSDRTVDNWDSLRQATTYRGYTEESAAVVVFWKVFGELSPEDKGKLLQFVTGSSRAPIGGFKQGKFVIQKGGDVKHLPTAHTCQNLLVLPDREEEAIVREHLAVCIAHCEGFGFI